MNMWNVLLTGDGHLIDRSECVCGCVLSFKVKGGLSCVELSSMLFNHAYEKILSHLWSCINVLVFIFHKWIDGTFLKRNKSVVPWTCSWILFKRSGCFHVLHQYGTFHRFYTEHIRKAQPAAVWTEILSSQTVLAQNIFRGLDSFVFHPVQSVDYTVLHAAVGGTPPLICFFSV